MNEHVNKGEAVGITTREQALKHFWEEILLPEVSKINEQAAMKLKVLYLQYQEFGEMNTRQLRYCAFRPQGTLMSSFVFGDLPVGDGYRREEVMNFWFDIHSKLIENGTYKELRKLMLNRDEVSNEIK